MFSKVFLCRTLLSPTKEAVMMTADNYILLMTPSVLEYSFNMHWIVTVRVILMGSTVEVPKCKLLVIILFIYMWDNAFAAQAMSLEWMVFPSHTSAFSVCVACLILQYEFPTVDGWPKSWWSGEWTISLGDLCDMSAFSSTKAHFHCRNVFRNVVGFSENVLRIKPVS